MRTLNKLYIVVLDKFEKGRHNFICNSITHDCEFSEEELYKIRIHFKKQRPTEDLHKSFYRNSSYNKNGLSWFSTGDKEIRIQFLKKLIRLTFF